MSGTAVLGVSAVNGWLLTFSLAVIFTLGAASSLRSAARESRRAAEHGEPEHRGIRRRAGIAIDITGLRPGENLEEAVIGPHETYEPLDEPSINAIVPLRLPRARLEETLELLDRLAVANDHDAAREVLLALARPATGIPDADAQPGRDDTPAFEADTELGTHSSVRR